ncbi:AidA/PixA family protein [Photorhabdus laumondii]|uniref:AidA/PixA family protein n=1 Tax=Photorhabdus laumondii TaxID=2218628 RepID=UPI0025B0B80B|nr:AidA/PixA family protein [Photorhabdus laumondii]
MSQRITDILVAVDVESLLGSLNKTQGEYNLVGGKYIHMMTYDGTVISDQGGSALNISAEIGDVIRWREVTLSADSNYSIVLTEFSHSFGEDLEKYLTKASVIPTYKYIPVLENINPLKIVPATYKVQSHYWQCTVIDRPESGKVTLQYTFKFQVFNNIGRFMGGGMWDPYITITAY